MHAAEHAHLLVIVVIAHDGPEHVVPTRRLVCATTPLVTAVLGIVGHQNTTILTMCVNVLSIIKATPSGMNR